MEKGLITFFNIDFAGFYQTKIKKDPLHHEGNISSALDSVISWAEKRDFIDTVPWDVDEHRLRSQFFFKSAYKDEETDDYLLVFLKKTSDDDGNFNGFKARSKFGDNQGDSVKVGKKINGESAIFGQPMYYWVIPEFNLIASIRFPHSLVDTDAVKDYIKRCIELRIPHDRRTTHERIHFNQKAMRDLTIKNIFFKSEDGKKSLKFYLKFTERRVTIGEVNHKDLAKKITHIVTRDVIKAKNIQANEHPILGLFSKFVTSKNNLNNKHVEVETEVSMTEEELIDTIRIYEEEYDPLNEWVNVGFRLEGEDNPKFFNSYLERSSIFLNPADKIDENYFSPETIFEEIKKSREDFLSSFGDDVDDLGKDTGTNG